MIYLDNAATTRIDPKALEKMMPFLGEDYGNPSGLYGFSNRARAAVEESRKIIAGCIGAEPDEIYFTCGGSESDSWAVKSAAMYLLCQAGNDNAGRAKILTSSVEHHAVLNAVSQSRELGCGVDYLSVDGRGIVTPEEMKKHGGYSFVSVMTANNELGVIEPIRELCSIAHENGAVFHTDAVQAVGHIPTDVKDSGVDMLSASAHKFNGPKGVGFLYVRRGIRLSPLISGGGQERGIRGGTENVAGIVGMAEALRINVESMEENARNLREMEEVFLTSLRRQELDFIVNGDERTNEIPGNVSVSFREAEGEMLLYRLDLMGICVSTGSACDSRNTELSHVIRAAGVDKSYAYGTIRVSFGKYNTVEEAEKTAFAVGKILKR